MTVLVVDDSSVVRKIVIRALRQAGFGDHDVIEAEAGAEGLAKGKETCPDVVRSGWNMPNMDGFKFFEALRAESDELPEMRTSGHAHSLVRQRRSHPRDERAGQPRRSEQARHVGERRRVDRIDSTVGSPAEGVEAELIANLDRGRSQAVVDRDAGAVGHPHQPRERGHGGRCLGRAVGTDLGDQGGSEVIDRCAGHRRFGEGQEGLTGRDTGGRRLAAAEGGGQVGRFAQRVTARTEQRGVGRRSIETLVHRRHP